MVTKKNDQLAEELLGLSSEECERFREAGFGKHIDERIEQLQRQKAINDAQASKPSDSVIAASVEWFVDHIREVRELRNWTQQDLASRLGMKRTHLSDFEGKRNDPRLSRILGLLAALGMTLDNFTVFAPDPATGKLPSMTTKRIRELLIAFEVDSAIADLLIKAYRKESAQNRLSRVLHVGEVLKDADVAGWLAKHVNEF